MHAFSRGVTACTLSLLALTLSGSAPEAGRPRPTGAVAGPSALPGAAAIRAQLAKLPLAFEPNVGQASADVRYVSLGPGPRLDLTDTEVRLTGHAARRGSNVVSLRLAGRARPRLVESQDELPGKVHHFDSNDPQSVAARHPDLPACHLSRCLSGHRSRLPRQPGRRRVRFRSPPGRQSRRHRDRRPRRRRRHARRPGRGDPHGRRHAAHARAGRLPGFRDGAEARRGRFSIQDSRIGFEIGAYDRARPLVIDPVVTYSTYLGGTGRENSIGVGVDAAGNIYAAMERQDDFGHFLPGQFVKLSADGQTLLYSVTLGDMRPSGLVADAAGNAYVVSTCPYDFPGVHFVCPTLKSLTSGAGLTLEMSAPTSPSSAPRARSSSRRRSGAWQRPPWRHCRR